MTYTKSKCIYSTLILTASTVATAAINAAHRSECVFDFKLISLCVRTHTSVNSRINSEREKERKFNCTLLFIQSYIECRHKAIMPREHHDHHICNVVYVYARLSDLLTYQKSAIEK